MRSTPIEEVINKIKLKHGDKITLVNPQDYKNSHSKLKFKCSEKNHPIWETKLYGITQGRGCPKCSGKNISTEDFIQELKETHGDKIKLVKGQKYKGRQHKLEFECHVKEHPNFFSRTGNVIYQKSGCPECKKDKLRKSFSLTTKEIYDKIKKELKGRVIPLKNQEYVNQKTIWEFKCKKHPEHPTWKTNVGTLFLRKDYVGCRLCLGENPISSKKDLINKINEKFNKKIKLINIKGKDFNKTKTKLELYCNKHNQHFSNTIYLLMKSKGCPVCSEESKQKNRRSKTEDLVNKLYSVHRNNIKYVNVDNYVNTETKMMFKCYKSSHGTFESTTHSVLGGRGCPVCKMSSGERKILFWLKDNKIKHEYQYRIRKTPKSKYFFIFDFYLPEKKMFIEYDGRQHYESIDVWGGDSGLEKRKKDDRLKNIISEKLGCKMLRIPYSNKNKIDKILTNEVGL